MTKVLVIEDEESVRLMVREVLAAAGYAVVEAVDAPSGFAAALAQKPDVILSDFIMPGVLDAPGKNLFENLSSDPRTKDIPIIVTSGLPAETVRSSLPERLHDCVMSKPFDYFRLKSLIEDVLKRSKGR